MRMLIVLVVLSTNGLVRSDSEIDDYDSFVDIQRTSASAKVETAVSRNRYDQPSMSLLAQLTNPAVMVPVSRRFDIGSPRFVNRPPINRRIVRQPVHLPPVQQGQSVRQNILPNHYRTEDPQSRSRETYHIGSYESSAEQKEQREYTPKKKYMAEPVHQPSYKKRQNSKQRHRKTPIVEQVQKILADDYKNKHELSDANEHKNYRARPTYVKPPPRKSKYPEIKQKKSKLTPIKYKPYPSSSAVVAESTEIHRTNPSSDGPKVFHATPKVEKRQTHHHGGYLDDKGLDFAAEAARVEHGAGEGRISFQIHGQKGPHSYRFGYDTGKGYNRQFRYEERDNHGHVKGRYGYYDEHGKMRVVNYSAHPKYGFTADVPKPHY